MSSETPASRRPRVLVFSTNAISDMGIDLAGSSHMDYSSSVEVIAVPCSGGVNPQWILHAIRAGFDGVFVAADGPECSYLTDCVARTGRVVSAAALIMVGTLAGLATGRVAGLQELGCGLAVGVLVDATLVRGLLMPSVMALCGQWTWWFPGLAARVLHVPAPASARVSVADGIE